jgi:hypothetical protein
MIDKGPGEELKSNIRGLSQKSLTNFIDGSFLTQIDSHIKPLSLLFNIKTNHLQNIYSNYLEIFSI